MKLERIDVRTASDEALREIYDLNVVLGNETRPEGDPIVPFEHNLARLRNLPAFLYLSIFLARDDSDRPVAIAQADWQEGPDNQHLAGISIGVLPDLRRQGIAKMMLPPLLDDIEAAGRRLVMFNTTEKAPSGQAVAEHLGAKAAYKDHTNRLLLSELDQALVRKWVDEGPGRAPGYTLVGVDGPYPDDMLDQVIPVHELMNTAPREDLDMEDWVITPERMREWEKTFFVNGIERWSLFARHAESDTLIGFTELTFHPARPRIAEQGGTAVHRDHQGHALGKWLKAAMLERLLAEKPHVQEIRTGNADSNEPMLAINTQLGFKPFRANTGWQISTKELRDYLGR